MDDKDNGYVVKKGVFEKQLLFLKKHFSIYSLENFFKLSASGKRRIRNPMVITVDDGYRNFFDHTFPILKKYSIPATIFVPLNFVETSDWMWQDKNIYILRKTKYDSYTFRWRDITISISTKPFEELINSLWRVYNACLPLALEDKASFSEELSFRLGVSVPSKPVPEFAPLSWEQIREMENHKISIGSHTMNHLALTYLSEAESRYEIYESKNLLEYRLGHAVRGFSYPNGNFNQTIVKQVKECGYMYALTTRKGNNRHLNNLFCLKRISPSHRNMTLFLKSIYL